MRINVLIDVVTVTHSIEIPFLKELLFCNPQHFVQAFCIRQCEYVEEIFRAPFVIKMHCAIVDLVQRLFMRFSLEWAI